MHGNTERARAARATAHRHAPRANGRLAADAELGREREEDIAYLTSTEHWMTRDLPAPIPVLGRGVLNKGSRMWIVGPTGTGKTHLAMGITAALSAGQGFLHWQAAAPVRVLYVDGEMPRTTLKKRIEALARRNPGADLSRVHWLSWQDAPRLAELHPELGEWAPLNTEKGRRFLLRYIKHIGGVDVIVLDNLMSLTEGAMKEEDGWRATEPLVMDLTALDIAQIWADHTGHNETRSYGTSTKTWRFETVALMLKPKAPVPDARIAFVLTFDPLRGGKCRERDDDNFADFETVAVRLIGDEWRVEPESEEDAAPFAPTRGGKLTAAQQGWFDAILRVFNTEGIAQQRVVPGSPPGATGPRVMCVGRDTLRNALRDAGRIHTDTAGNITATSRAAFADMLNLLADKRKLGHDGRTVWLPDRIA